MTVTQVRPQGDPLEGKENLLSPLGYEVEIRAGVAGLEGVAQDLHKAGFDLGEYLDGGVGQIDKAVLLHLGGQAQAYQQAENESDDDHTSFHGVSLNITLCDKYTGCEIT
jgi:hypothetical protein